MRLALPCALSLFAAPVADGPASFTREQMREDLAVLRTAVVEQWSYLEDKETFLGVDVEGRIAEIEEALPERASAREFRDQLRELVASFRDGHGGLSMQPEVTRRRWPFTLADVGGELRVVRVDGGDGPALGARLVAVDDRPVEERLLEVQRSTIVSSPQVLRHHALVRMHWSEEPELAFTFLEEGDGEGGGEVRGSERRLVLATLDREPAALRRHPPRENWSLDWPAPGIARLTVTSFAVADWQGWLSASVEERPAFLEATKHVIQQRFAEIEGAQGLVLDLRGNGGGTDSLGIVLAKHLMPKRFVYFRLSAKYEGEWTSPHGYEHEAEEGLPVFRGPIAALIDEECFSTTDNFLRCLLEQHPEAIAIGRPTNGGTGAPRPIVHLPNSGATITLCTQRVYGPRGELTESRGTLPRIPIAWTLPDWLDPQAPDPDLAAALEWLP